MVKNNKTQNVTTAIIIDTRIKRDNGLYPIKLRVTFLRKQKYFNIVNSKFENISMTIEDYNKTFSPRPRDKYKELNIYLTEFETRAKDILEKIDIFTFEIFEQMFYKKTLNNNDVFLYYDNYISELSKNNKIGTSEVYQVSKNSIKSFIKKDKLDFNNITVNFLNDYEKFMIAKGNTLTSVGIRLRCLRKLFNNYLENNDLPKNKNYPFGKNKYQIPNGQNIKKALKKSDIIKIKNYEPETDAECFAKDMFLFSYLCNGINISDILRLKFKNIQGDKIYFIREKTKNTTKNNQHYIEVFISDIVNEIIDKWKNNEVLPNNYIFRELNNNMNEIEKRKRTQQVTKNINKYLKRIANKLELNINLTTYVARHSFATILMREGASIEFIGENLGHSSISTTQNYLGSFDDEYKIEKMKKLL